MSSKISQPPKVFVSYSWDSEEHKNSVLDLADNLRTHGIDCNIDRFEVSLTEGWQSWMRNQIKQSDFVLTVCTEQYKKSFQGKTDLDKGEGITWKGAIINQLICDRTSSAKFIPIIFSREAGRHIPHELRKFTYYLLDGSNLDLDEKGYHSLYQHLTNQSITHENVETVVSLPSLPHHHIEDPIQDKKNQEKKLTESYQEIRRLYRARYWQKVTAMFQKMQQDNLPYFDPDGFYRKSRQETLKEEQQKRQLNNIYNQGIKYYQEKEWLQARKKFKEVLSFGSRDRDLQIKVQQKLTQIQKQIKQKKQIAIGAITFSWLISSILPMGIRVTGGFVSAIVIWYMSQTTRHVAVSQQVVKLLLFILSGIIIEVVIWQILGHLLNSSFVNTIAPIFAFMIGTAISLKAMFWQTPKWS